MSIICENHSCFQCVSSNKPCVYRIDHGSCAGCDWFLSCASCNFSDYDYESGSFECIFNHSREDIADSFFKFKED